MFKINLIKNKDTVYRDNTVYRDKGISYIENYYHVVTSEIKSSVDQEIYNRLLRDHSKDDNNYIDVIKDDNGYYYVCKRDEFKTGAVISSFSLQKALFQWFHVMDFK